MPLVTSEEILLHAMKKGYAVPSFNANCYEMIPALIRAAEMEQAPLIVQLGKKLLGYAPADEFGALAIHLAKKAKVPVCIHLDHGADLKMAIACLESGYTSIMYDGSTLSEDENIIKTREVVECAKAYGVPVEGEIGEVPLVEDVQDVHAPSGMTEPEQAIRFVQETGVASVAVAVGNIHRMKQKGAMLDFPRIQALREAVSIPLVIHGCSGVSDADVRRAIQCGISKVNVATEFSIAFTGVLREFTVQNPAEFFPMEVMRYAMECVTAIAVDRIQVLGASGKY